MREISYVKISAEIFKAPVRSVPKVCILALASNFGMNGLRTSNDKLAKLFCVHKRTVEKAISELREESLIADTGRGKNDRCLIVTDKITIKQHFFCKISFCLI